VGNVLTEWLSASQGLCSMDLVNNGKNDNVDLLDAKWERGMTCKELCSILIKQRVYHTNSTRHDTTHEMAVRQRMGSDVIDRNSCAICFTWWIFTLYYGITKGFILHIAFGRIYLSLVRKMCYAACNATGSSALSSRRRAKYYKRKCVYRVSVMCSK